MNFRKNFSSQWVIPVVVLATSCEYEQLHRTQPVSVYVAGESNGLPVYWKDDVMIPLSTEPGGAYSIAVAGEDVYVAGTVSTLDYSPGYWKNGVLVKLPGPGRESNMYSVTTSIAVSGNDVYIASVSCPPYDYCRASYWKNGTSTPLERGGGRDVVSSIAVSTSHDVYVVGSGYPATVWKNGDALVLSDDSDLGPSSSSVFVDRDDVYVAGTISPDNIYIACYWKNGELVRVSEGTSHAVATAIFVSEGDVYVAGNQITSTGNKATVWKNGVAQELTNGKTFGTATCVSVSGDDVYVGGVEFNESKMYVGKYWKNGEEVVLSNGTGSSYVHSIVVK